MQTFLKVTFILLLFAACQEDSELNAIPDIDSELLASLPNTNAELRFKYKKINAGDDSVYEVRTSKVYQRNAGWSYWVSAFWLSREIFFEVVPEGGEAFEVSLYLRKNEPDSSILLLENEGVNYWERNWDYKSFQHEAKNFYGQFDEARFNINYTTLSVFDTYNSIEVAKTQKALINGTEKTYVEIKFNGEAFGVYDPNKEFLGYSIQEGSFRGNNRIVKRN